MEDDVRALRGQGQELTGIFEGWGAATEMAWQSADVGFQRDRQKAVATDELARKAAQKMGMAGLRQILEAEPSHRVRGATMIAPNIAPPFIPDTVDEALQTVGSATRSLRILEEARRQAKADPRGWADLDLTEETLDAELTKRRNAELRDNQTIIAYSPRPGMVSVLGGVTAGVADPINIVAAPFGVAGGFLRTIASEAALNASIEAAQHPARVRVAKELGQPAPNLAEDMTYGAIGGAGVAAVGMGVVAGARRGLDFWKARNRIKVPPGASPLVAEDAIRQAEDAILGGQHPGAIEVRPLWREGETAPYDPNDMADEAPRAPLIPPEAFQNAPQASPEPRTAASTPLADVLPPQTEKALPDAVQAQISAIENEADAVQQRATGGWKSPVMTSMRKSGMRIDPASPDGAELYQILGGGKTANRTVPGLFRKGKTEGRGLDNMPAADWEDRFPGIIDATGTARDATYLDRDGVLELLRREAGGDHTWMPGVQEANAIRSTITSQAIDDFVAMQPGQRVVPVGGDVSGAIDGYLKARDMRLLDREREAIADQLTARGGDLEILVEIAMSRELEDFERAMLRGEIPDDTSRNAARTDGAPPETAGPDGIPLGEPEATGRNAPERGAGSGQPAQDAFPGTDRIQTGVAQAQKAEVEARALQSRIGRLDQVRVEDDPTSLFAPEVRDMFDDITSPKAAAYMDAQVAAWRTEGGFDEVLGELDEMDTMVREFAACLTGKVTP